MNNEAFDTLIQKKDLAQAEFSVAEKTHLDFHADFAARRKKLDVLRDASLAARKKRDDLVAKILQETIRRKSK